MSYRRTRGGGGGGYRSPNDQGSVFSGGSAGGPPLQLLIAACIVVGVVGLGLALAFTPQASAPVAQAPSAAAVQPTAAAAAPTVAPTTAAAAPAVSSEPPVGDPETTGSVDAGAALFVALPSAATPCTACHNIAPGSGTLVGPSLSGLGARAGNTVAGETAAQYVRAAIVAPNNHVVSGFVANIMPLNYGDVLTEDQVEDLVAYLLSLP